jgi:serine/threonine-protein phosphatase 2A regulatory subunit A
VNDSIPSVRKYASMNFKDMVKLYPLITEGIITGTLNALLKDEQDFIRMYVVDSTVALCKTQLHTKNNNIAIQFFKTLAEDLSWRVRYYFCDKLVEVPIPQHAQVATSSGKEQYRKLFQPYHLKFL